MLALGLAYAAFIVAQWSLGYIDFGDGNYMYIGRRIAEGGVVYRDILAPQPPCHLFFSALIWKIADLLRLSEPIYAFRLFSLLLRLATFALVARLAWRAWGRPWTTVLAGAIYLWLPIGTWWSLGYQSEPLETFFLLTMLLAALRGTRGGDIAAGMLAAPAALTNATAWPFLTVLLLYLLVRAPRRAPWILLPWLVLSGIVTVILHLWTDGAFLVNIVLNQVGTYPPGWSERFAYGLGKILGQGTNVLTLEGFFVFAALIGLVRLLRDSPLAPLERGALAWYCLATLGAIIYVTKGGTMDYIFSLSEPAVALLAAGELAAWGRRWRGTANPEPAGGWRVGRIGDFWPKLVAAGVLALFAGLHAVHFYASLWRQVPYELASERTDKLTHVIARHSQPDQLVLAPPFYAVRANRRIWGDYSELFIWIFKYQHDRFDTPPNPNGEGWSKIRKMAEAIDRRTIAIVVLEMDQTGRADEVMLALQRNYVPLRGFWNDAPREECLFQTRNTRLGIFLPAPAGETPEQALARGVDWQAFKRELLGLYGSTGIQKFGMWYDRNPGP